MTAEKTLELGAVSLLYDGSKKVRVKNHPPNNAARGHLR